MDTRTRKVAGWVIAAAGAVVLVVGALADQLGIGGEGADEFGGKQIAAVVAGLVVLAIGLVIALLPLGARGEPQTD